MARVRWNGSHVSIGPALFIRSAFHVRDFDLEHSEPLPTWTWSTLGTRQSCFRDSMLKFNSSEGCHWRLADDTECRWKRTGKALDCVVGRPLFMHFSTTSQQDLPRQWRVGSRSSPRVVVCNMPAYRDLMFSITSQMLWIGFRCGLNESVASYLQPSVVSARTIRLE